MSKQNYPEQIKLEEECKWEEYQVLQGFNESGDLQFQKLLKVNVPLSTKSKIICKANGGPAIEYQSSCTKEPDAFEIPKEIQTDKIFGGKLEKQELNEILFEAAKRCKYY